MHDSYAFVRLQEFLLHMLSRDVFLSNEYLPSARHAHSTLLCTAKNYQGERQTRETEPRSSRMRSSLGSWWQLRETWWKRLFSWFGKYAQGLSNSDSMAGKIGIGKVSCVVCSSFYSETLREQWLFIRVPARKATTVFAKLWWMFAEEKHKKPPGTPL